jgi:hypothetical protein
MEAYTHIIKRQTYRALGYETPVFGWGNGEPTLDWSSIYNTSSLWGGFAYAGLPNFSIAKEYLSEITTAKLKEEFCRIGWLMGATIAGKESVFPIIPSFSLGGYHINYGMIEGELKKSPMNSNDIFTDITIEYGYDAQKKGGKNTISVTSPDQPSFQRSFVSGVGISEEQAIELWEMGHALWVAYGGIKNSYPNKDCSLIVNSADAIDFVKKAYQWQGVTKKEGSWVVYERYQADFVVPVDTVVDGSLGLGTPIQIDIPLVAFQDKGIIVSVEPDYLSGRGTVRAEMLGTKTVQRDTLIIERGLSFNDETITEMGTGSYEQIIEGRR